MSLFELTVFPETPLYEYRATLSAREYVLRFDYNEREDRWFLYLFDAASALISGPMKIRPGVPLLRKVRWKDSCPAGEIIALDPSGTVDSPGAAPTWNELGRRVRLFYDDGITEAAA